MQTHTQTAAMATSESKNGLNAGPMMPPKWLPRLEGTLHVEDPTFLAFDFFSLTPLSKTESCTDEPPVPDSKSPTGF